MLLISWRALNKVIDLIAIDTAYIIGGLVDRTVIKNASYDRAKYLDIPAVQLPIR